MITKNLKEGQIVTCNYTDSALHCQTLLVTKKTQEKIFLQDTKSKNIYVLPINAELKFTIQKDS